MGQVMEAMEVSDPISPEIQQAGERRSSMEVSSYCRLLVRLRPEAASTVKEPGNLGYFSR
jgi:hypothetical protein